MEEKSREGKQSQGETIKVDQRPIAGLKRSWKLQDKSDEDEILEDAGQCKKLKASHEELYNQVEEASLMAPGA